MDLLQEILKLLIMILVPTLFSVATYYAREIAYSYIEKVEQEQTANALAQGFEIILAAVNCTQQTYVDELKKNNSFTLEAQKKALASAKEKALALMNNEIQDAIVSSYGNLDEYVSTIIENIVYQNKQN